MITVNRITIPKYFACFSAFIDKYFPNLNPKNVNRELKNEKIIEAKYIFDNIDTRLAFTYPQRLFFYFMKKQNFEVIHHLYKWRYHD